MSQLWTLPVAMFKSAWHNAPRGLKVAVGLGYVGGVLGAGCCGKMQEEERVAKVEAVTKAPKLLLLDADPMLKMWQRAAVGDEPIMAGSYVPVIQAAEQRGVTWRMPGNLVIPKDPAFPTPLPRAVPVPQPLPLTVLDTHPPVVETSLLSSPWLALAVLPIPFMVAFRIGCFSVAPPGGCTSKPLLQRVLCDPTLQYYVAREDDTPFQDVFEPDMSTLPPPVPFAGGAAAVQQQSAQNDVQATTCGSGGTPLPCMR